MPRDFRDAKTKSGKIAGIIGFIEGAIIGNVFFSGVGTLIGGLIGTYEVELSFGGPRLSRPNRNSVVLFAS